MVLWMNDPNERRQLLSKGRVYILRSKAHRGGKEKLTKGTETLMYDVKADRGKISFTFLKTIKDEAALREYVPQSGFLSVEEWLKVAKKSRHLYLIKMLKS